MTIAAIILTYNEEQHLERCIQSLQGVADEIFVVDSFSTDKTMELAKAMGAQCFQNPFVNHVITSYSIHYTKLYETYPGL